MKETPTTEQVREGYAVAFIPSAKERGRRRFNSWLTKHDAEVKAEERARIVAMLDADIEQHGWDGELDAGVMRAVRLIRRIEAAS